MALTRAIDIRSDQRKALISLLSGHLPNTEAWIYGSRVGETSRPESDLDMVVFTAPDQGESRSRRSVSLAEIGTHGHVLTPGRYVGAAPQDDDGEPFKDNVHELVARLREQQAEGTRLDRDIASILEAMGFWGESK